MFSGKETAAGMRRLDGGTRARSLLIYISKEGMERNSVMSFRPLFGRSDVLSVELIESARGVFGGGEWRLANANANC